MEKISLKEAKKGNKVNPKAKSTKTSKEAATDEKTAKVVKEKVAKEKDVMYNYEPGLDALEKKKFRAAARRTRVTWDKKIKSEKDSEKRAKLVRKANKWAQATYTPEHLVEFE